MQKNSLIGESSNRSTLQFCQTAFDLFDSLDQRFGHLGAPHGAGGLCLVGLG
jgi:hypothetical protein